MDRLIYKEADGDLTCRSRDFDKVFPTLYAYEELELTPQEIEQQLTNFSSFLMEMTHGRMSKTNYTVQAMVTEANDCTEKELDEARQEGYDLGVESVLRNHFDIPWSEAGDIRKNIDHLRDLIKAEQEGRLVILDAPMVPVMEDLDPLSSDVFCPRCNENLSGAFGDEERILLQCPKCGQYIDGTKSMPQTDALEWLAEED